MPYSDSNPERRNLVIMSLTIIIFYLGEGAAVDDTLSLPLISIVFKKPEALGVIAVLALAWFALRHWQVNQSNARHLLVKELSLQGNSRPARFYIRRQCPEESKDKMMLGSGRAIIVVGQEWLIQWDYPSFIIADEGQNVEPSSRLKQDSIRIEHNFKGLMAKLGIIAVCAWRQPSIASYYFPFLMFMFASYCSWQML